MIPEQESSTIRLSHSEIEETLDLLEVDWPGCMEIAGELYKFFATSLHFRHDMMAALILEEGLRQYRSVTIGVAEKVCDVCRMARFVNGILDGACAHMAVIVMADDGESWSLESSTPFSEWEKGRPRDLHPYHHENMDIRKVRQQLYERLVSDKIKEKLKRFDYEAAIVDHSLDLDCRAATDPGVCARRVD